MCVCVCVCVCLCLCLCVCVHTILGTPIFVCGCLCAVIPYHALCEIRSVMVVYSVSRSVNMQFSDQ